MSEQVYTIEEIKSILQPVFAEHGVERAILFGSYAKGNALPNSDIDILVDSGLKGLAFYGLLEDTVESLNKEVDLIDTSQIIKGSQIANEISRSGVEIYGQERQNYIAKNVRLPVG